MRKGITSYMNRKDLLLRARQWKKVIQLLGDDSVTVSQIVDQNPWLEQEGSQNDDPPAPAEVSKPNGNPLSPEVLKMLKETTGLGDAEAWRRIWLLVSKSEHDNTDPAKAFLTDKGKSLFAYASALSYDWKERGVTMGIVGWTTGNDGKDGRGDAPELFKVYKSLGGEDLMPYCDGCCKDKAKCTKLIKKIESLADDPLWIQAQWKQLVTKADCGAYLYHTVSSFKKIGIDSPSALAIATVFDASLNQGYDGKDGGCVMLEKLGVKGDENATLEKYNQWRAKVAGTNDYNSPPINGKNRAKQFEDLRKAKVFTLTGGDALKEIQRAISWEMK